MKPINGKAYGSIPHLPGSAMFSGDHRIQEGQGVILTEKSRHNDQIVVTEKYDGSCVAVARVEGVLLPLTRNGHLATTSPYEQHQVFAAWVSQREDLFEGLQEGERVVGEWLMKTHTIPYSIAAHHRRRPIVWFDYFGADGKRHSYQYYLNFTTHYGLSRPRRFHIGQAITPQKIIAGGGNQEYSGRFSEGDPRFQAQNVLPEGLVYRCVTDGQTNFLGKWVRPNFEPGLYMKSEMLNLRTDQILL